LEGRDEIKDLFSDKLGNFEANVRPELWSNVASQIGAGAAAGGTSAGLSIVAKWFIGVGISAAVITGGVVAYNQLTGESEQPITKQNTDQLASENSIEESEAASSDPKQIQSEAYVVDRNELVSNSEVSEQETDEMIAELNATELESSTEENILITEIKNGLRTTEKTEVVTEETTIETERTEETVIEEEVTKEVITTEETTEEAQEDAKIESLPNVFTPDGDGVNDELFVSSKGLNDFNIVVLNGSNQIVYTSQDPNFRWDGRDQGGMPVPNGNYVYYLTAKDSKGNGIREYSRLTITR